MKKIFFIFALSGILAACTVGGGVSAGGVSAGGGSNGVGLGVGIGSGIRF
ncbi:hypothetical protein CGSHi22121_08328 [Haemophilus influenzae 22.1-21]|nr:hypothetical protein [Haemophilus influenzae]EDJ88018.1 hypothetical protein CGSHi22121_08328 [Haemophilus influenzae 22.1-21]MCK8802265.1 hypothetical protein [Haemophilus influenzae]MCK8885746.1 hypothetical protein [Haemophilus influenzae]MCK9071837.1 hypothetical protein [Haemophilus influenzae]MCK9145818.1 hypothetical protein [Haemophilus influenzae]